MPTPSSLSALALSSLMVLTASARQPPLPAPAQAPAPGKMALTVDSIMRGPDLVGYPPFGLRWSGDSRDLFFEWRKPGEKESATYYPVENHAFEQETSWADEHRRIPKLFETALRQAPPSRAQTR